MRKKNELTRRGFVILAASAFGAFFIKPPLVAASGDRDYLVSIQTIGYGYLWPEEDEDDDFMFEADSAEIQREAWSLAPYFTSGRTPTSRKTPPGLTWSRRTARSSAIFPGEVLPKRRVRHANRREDQ